MTKGHLMNVEQHQAAADPQTKPPDFNWAVSLPVVYSMCDI